jgi:drug/metabolite transporter (DMT)-like permease
MSPTQRGMGLFVASFFLAALVDAPVKYLLVSGMPQPTVMFFRFAIAIVFLLLMRLASGRLFTPTRYARLNLLRGLILASSSLVNFYALKTLDLAVAASINFAAPLIACAFAHVFLGERVGIRRWLAVLVGFAGVLIVMRPGSAAFHPAMFCALANAFLIAAYQIVTRKVGSKDEPETGLLWVFAVGLVVSILILPLGWQAPELRFWPVLILIGAAGMGTHFLVSRALQLAEASILAPLIYTQIIWMIFFGIMLFSNWPDRWTLLGTSIIVASGIYIWHRERINLQPAAT